MPQERDPFLPGLEACDRLVPKRQGDRDSRQTGSAPDVEQGERWGVEEKREQGVLDLISDAGEIRRPDDPDRAVPKADFGGIRLEQRERKVWAHIAERGPGTEIRHKAPVFFRCTRIAVAAEGRMPGIRVAWPKVIGRAAPRRSRTSAVSPATWR